MIYKTIKHILRSLGISMVVVGAIMANGGVVDALPVLLIVGFVSIHIGAWIITTDEDDFNRYIDKRFER